MLTQILLINKNGTIKDIKALDVSRETLYKKCGYKKPDGFEKRVEWKVKHNNENLLIEVWARDSGKANTENKYDFPPPIDKALYFGTCAIILTNPKGIIKNLSTDTWKKTYETLFGGFHDISKEEEEEENDELSNVPTKMKTKAGYLKDGFVVDTNSDDEETINVVDEDDYNDEEAKNEDDEEAENEDDGEDIYEETENDENVENLEDSIESDEKYNENTNSDTELDEEEYNYSDEE